MGAAATCTSSAQYSATPEAVINEGDTISDTATVSGTTPDATGTVTFDLYGPDDVDCSGDVVFTSTVDTEREGDVLLATSEAFTPTEPGTYRWIASYSGDANNLPSAGACNDEGETSVVRQGFIPELEKVADPASGSEVGPGQTITYTVTAQNTGPVPLHEKLPALVTPTKDKPVPSASDSVTALASGAPLTVVVSVYWMV